MLNQKLGSILCSVSVCCKQQECVGIELCGLGQKVWKKMDFLTEWAASADNIVNFPSTVEFQVMFI